MKNLIVCLGFLALAGCASTPEIAACKADAVSSFVTLKAKAGIESATMHFRSGMIRKDWAGRSIQLNGMATPWNESVYIDPELLCSDKRKRDFVIAHEIGHLKTKPDYSRITREKAEEMADNYAVVLLGKK